MKRIFDFIAALLGLIFLSPLFLIITILIRYFLGTPVIFRQLRAGFRSKPFLIYKFRTMIATNTKSEELTDLERITRFGTFLRSTSLDELPELYNILKGDMSFVGPRPLFVDYLPLYSQDQSRRHNVRPGLTGWAQVNGRNDLTWEDKFNMDIWYVDNHSLWLDFRILLKTLFVVLLRKGVTKEGFATTDYFKGSDK